jgi:hypothetical protein
MPINTRSIFHAAFFGGLPRFFRPVGISQSCSLQFGHVLGLPSIRFTHRCLHRRQAQIMLLGMAIALT